jgi:hypothetical protein
MQTMTDEVFNDILTVLKHAVIFISSRQKMHEDGIKLHTDLIHYLEKNASQPVIQTDAKLRCDLCGRREIEPFDEGDNCYCGGVFRTA